MSYRESWFEPICERNPKECKQEIQDDGRDRFTNVIRPSVLYFALRMEEKLRKHDKDRGEYGWSNYTDPDGQRYLLNRLKGEVAELETELNKTFEFIEKHPEEQMARSSSETIDVANFAMMLYTAFGPVEYSKRMADWLLESLRSKEREQQ